MDISSISSPGLISYNSQNSQSAGTSTNSSDTVVNDNKTTNNSASVVQAIEDAASGNNSLAMIDALKMIGGSGSANIAALVNVAQSDILDTLIHPSTQQSTTTSDQVSSSQ